MTVSIPSAAIEAAAEAIYKTMGSRDDDFTLEARAAIEAAMPAIREALAQEIDLAPIPFGMTLVSTSDFMGGRAHASLIVRGGAA